MPRGAPRVCARCRRVVPRGAVCVCRPAYEASTHPGGTRRWQRVRIAKLKKHPICQWHAGCRMPADEVDHIVPLAENGSRWDPHNMQSLCINHHIEKTVADARRGKTRLR